MFTVSACHLRQLEEALQFADTVFLYVLMIHAANSEYFADTANRVTTASFHPCLINIY